MSVETIPRALRSQPVLHLLETHRSHHGLAALVEPGAEGVPIMRGSGGLATRVATLQATGPDDAVELLVCALGAILDLEEESRHRHADLGRRLHSLSLRLERMRGEFDQSLKRQTEDLLTMNRQLITAATTDSLTGLLNRRAIEARMEEIEAMMSLESLPVAVIMADVDHFKRINDTHGHLVGDAVLAQVAEVFRGRCRASDVVGRWGGEEFVVLLPGCTVGPAGKLAEDLRAQLADHPFHVSGGCFSVTSSFGVAAGVLGPASSLVALLEEADHHLYEAKGAGRNRVSAAEHRGASQAC